MKFAALVLSCLSLLPVVLSFSPEARLSNAQRLARGLTPLPPRRLFNANVARDSAPSGVTPPPAAPTTATGIRAVYAGRSASAPSIGRRQSIGSVAGYMDHFGRINVTLTESNTQFGTGVSDVAVGVLPLDLSPPEYICLSNNYAEGGRPVSLSRNSGNWVVLGFCDPGLDQPAGSPAIEGPDADQAGYYGETRVWQIDPATGLVTFYYANTDGTVVDSQVSVVVTCSDAKGPILPVYVTANVPLFLQAYLAMYPFASADPESCVAQVLNLYFETS